VANLSAKFEVSSFNRSQDMEGSQNSKSRSREPFTTLLTYFCIFSLGPPVANLPAEFEVSSFNRSRDMERVPKFTHSLTHSLTNTQTDFIICPMLLTHWADKNKNKHWKWSVCASEV